MEQTETTIKRIGLTDMPWTPSDEDMLDTRKYARTLCTFPGWEIGGIYRKSCLNIYQKTTKSKIIHIKFSI